MKNLLYFFLLLFLITSCVDTSHTPQPKEQTLPAVVFVDSFVKTHPNWANNDLTKEKANKDYLEQLKDTSLLYSLVDGIDVTFSEIRKDKSGKYIAHFYSWFANEELKHHNVDEFMFDIITCVNDTLVDKLIEKKEYKCKWKIISNVDYDTFCTLYGNETTVIQDKKQIEIDNLEGIKLSLGCFYADLKGIEPVGE